MSGRVSVLQGDCFFKDGLSTTPSVRTQRIICFIIVRVYEGKKGGELTNESAPSRADASQNWELFADIVSLWAYTLNDVSSRNEEHKSILLSAYQKVSVGRQLVRDRSEYTSLNQIV
jgi:hypothetical protein